MKNLKEKLVDPSGIEPVSLRETFLKAFSGRSKAINALNQNTANNSFDRKLVDPSGIEPLTS